MCTDNRESLLPPCRILKGLEFPKLILRNLENLKFLENSSNEKQTVNSGTTYRLTVRTSK